jgi:hypothetical protein
MPSFANMAFGISKLKNLFPRTPTVAAFCRLNPDAGVVTVGLESMVSWAINLRRTIAPPLGFLGSLFPPSPQVGR